MAMHLPEDPIGRRGRDLGTEHAFVHSLTAPEEEWRVGSAV